MTPFAGGNKITSPFGPRKSPITGGMENHKGQDVVATDGNWLVRECTGGRVLRVEEDRWRGKFVDVGTSANVFERYQHMDDIYVKKGQEVLQGEILGLAGSTGDVTGRHLHFGVYKNGNSEGCAVLPMQWSGLANIVGVQAGNNTINGRAENFLQQGDAVLELAKELNEKLLQLVNNLKRG